MNRIPLLIILLLVIVGGIYGYVSATNNMNPNPIERQEGDRISQEIIDAGKAWQPSPIWLPSYLVATLWRETITIERGPLAGKQISIVGYGLSNVDGKGYAANSKLQTGKYSTASIAVGAIMGLLLAIIVLLVTGKVSIRSSR